MKAFIVILIIIAVICGGLYFLFSSTQQVDVAWTEQDYKSYLQKMAAAETAGQATGSTTEGQNSKEGGNTKEQNGTDSGSQILSLFLSRQASPALKSVQWFPRNAQLQMPL